MEVLQAECRVSLPFRAGELPLAARAYRYRKGAHAERTLGQKVARALLPSKLFLKAWYQLAHFSQPGHFYYRRHGIEREIAFRVANTQYHAVYFPQYAAGYEPETTCLFERLIALDPRGTIYDIGANWGFYALQCAAAPNFAGRIHAFEPAKATFADLTDVVEQACLKDVVTCHQAAVGDANCESYLAAGDGITSGMASLSSDTRGEKTRVIALDQFDAPPPTMMKVDVEGYEAAVFAGGRRTLVSARPMIIFESWIDPRDPAAARVPLNILAELGYRFFHPALQRGDGDMHCLELREFDAAGRSQLPQHFNIFACHTSRFEELRAEFELALRDQQPLAAAA